MKIKKKWWIVAGVCLALVVLSGIIGYKIGKSRQLDEDYDTIYLTKNRVAKLEKELAELKSAGNTESTPSFSTEPTSAPNADSDPETTSAPGVTVTTAPTKEPGASITPVPSASVAPGASVTPVPSAGITPTQTPGVSVTPTKAPTTAVTPTKAPTVTAIPTKAPTKAPTKSPKAPTKAPAKNNTKLYYGALHVNGTHIVDKDNNPVILRGISSHGLGWFPEYINEAAIRQFKEEWGCNVIRLAMYTAEYNGYCTSNDAQKANLKKIVDTGVQAATKNDMYVIIDWHILSDGNPNTNKDEAKKFFQEVSKKYAGNPHVLYEICNEPNGNVTWKDVKKYAEEIIPVIRKNAPDAIIIVGSPTWSQDVDLAAQDPIKGDNIAYSLHFYAATHKQNLRDKAKKAIDKGLCLLVTEYGVCDSSGNGALDLKEADTWIDFLNKNQIGYIAWNLSNKAETSSMIKASCSKVNGFTKDDMSKGGQWFLDMLKKEAGGLGADGTGTTEAGEVSGDVRVGVSEEAKDYTVYEEKYLAPEKGVVARVTNGWDSGSYAGVQVTIYIENNTDRAETNWVRKIKVNHPEKVRLAQSWNAEVTYEKGVITLRPVEHNRTISANSTLGDIGIILEIDN